jgi:hypothetical protein
MGLVPGAPNGIGGRILRLMLEVAGADGVGHARRYP